MHHLLQLSLWGKGWGGEPGGEGVPRQAGHKRWWNNEDGHFQHSDKEGGQWFILDQCFVWEYFSPWGSAAIAASITFVFRSSITWWSKRRLAWHRAQVSHQTSRNVESKIQKYCPWKRINKYEVFVQWNLSQILSEVSWTSDHAHFHHLRCLRSIYSSVLDPYWVYFGQLFFNNFYAGFLS